MKITNIRNPIYANSENTVINCEIQFENSEQWLPFSASIDDVEEHGRMVFEAIQNGDTVVVADYVPPPAPEPQIPNSITARQARLALHSIGQLANVQTAIASLPAGEKEVAEIEWEYASSIERNHSFVDSLAGALGLTETEIDELFILGATM